LGVAGVKLGVAEAGEHAGFETAVTQVLGLALQRQLDPGSG
jgi:hypothetical protein